MGNGKNSSIVVSLMVQYRCAIHMHYVNQTFYLRQQRLLPVLISLSEFSDVVNNQQVTASTCSWHVLLLMQPLLVILISAILQPNQTIHLLSK